MVQMFLRQASGLVRTVDTKDVFIYNITMINVGIGISMMVLLGPSFYPGVNLTVGIVIATFFCMMQVFAYYSLVTAMPRTGGEYIFISRILHPALGLSMSVSMAMWMVFYSAWSAMQFANMGLAPIFSDLARNLGSPTFAAWSKAFSGNVGGFVVGTIMVLAASTLLASGTERYFKVQAWTFVPVGLGLVVLIGVLAFSSRADFIAAFNAAAEGIAGPNQYETVIATAKKTGWTNPGFSLVSSLKFMVWPLAYVGYAIMSCSFAGEIKRHNRTQFIGSPICMAVAAGLFVVMVLLAERVMGYDFLGAIGWNTYEAPEASLPTTPWLHLLTQTLTRGNILLDLIIGVGFALWTWYWIGGCMLYATRHAFAWSFDRVMPKAMGKVSSRYHTPINSIILCAVVAEISLALYCFTEWFNTLVGIFAMTFMFFFVGISAIVFPYVRRELFESSPMNYRIFGIPLVSIFGLLTSIFMAYMLYCFYYDDVAAGNNLPSLIAVFGPMIIAFIYYFVAQGIRKSREGIDVSYTFKEIPVE